MDAVNTIAPEEATTTERSPSERANERRCLATGEMLTKDALIRFVVGPDQILVPDLAQTLPGRGLWVKADLAAVTLAIQKNLFSKSAKTAVKLPADMLAQLAIMLRRRCLDFLGFARRAGIAVLGQPQVESALKANKIALLFLADDATQAIDSRLTVPTIRLFTRDELGAALGHEQLVYVGLKSHSLTETLRLSLDRLGNITPHHQIS